MNWHATALSRRAMCMISAVTVAVGLVGCSTQVTGAAVKDPAVKAGDIDTALLQPGNYPTSPLPASKASAETAAIVDAQQLADFVVGPWEADPALVKPNPTGTLVIKNAEALELLLLAPATQIAAAHQFINGFSTDRITGSDQTGHGKGLGNIVMRFPTADDATAAAADFAAQLPSVPGASPLQPIPIGGHPEAKAVQSTLSDGTFTVASFTVQGPYVLYQYARAQESLDVATALVAATLDLQTGRIDGFKPTDPAQFATMTVDPSGLVAKTIPAPKPTVNVGVYGARGILHFQIDPILAGRLYSAAGLDAASVGKTKVYQTKDPGAATELATKLAGIIGNGAPPEPAVPGLPAAKCVTSTDTNPLIDRYSCVTSAGRWVITASSQQDRDVTQQIAAQYLMLVGK
jgi:hypothetical protein